MADTKRRQFTSISLSNWGCRWYNLMSDAYRDCVVGAEKNTAMIPLIPRKAFFGNPDRTAVQISPDGAHLSWLAPLDGVMNVWVADRNDITNAQPVTSDTGRGIRIYNWAFTNNHILFQQDVGGDENFRLYALELVTGSVLDLTPFNGVRVMLKGVSHKFPDEVVVGLNNRNPQWHDIYRVNILTGEKMLLVQHDRFSGITPDDTTGCEARTAHVRWRDRGLRPR